MYSSISLGPLLLVNRRVSPPHRARTFEITHLRSPNMNHTTTTPPLSCVAYRVVPTESATRYFIDDHRAGEMSVDLLRRHLHALRHAQPQRVGQARLVACLGGDGTVLSCVVEAADAAAVQRWHTLQGLPCGQIRPTDWARSARPSEPSYRLGHARELWQANEL